MDDKADDSWLLYKTARGTIYLLLQNVVVAASGSVFFVFIARFLPNTSDLGLVSGLQLIINMAVVLAGLGLTSAATRFMSYHFGGKREDLAIGIGVLIFRLGLFSSIAISFVLYSSAYYITIMLFHDLNYVHLIRLGSIDVFLLSMMSFSISILYSLHEFRKIAIVSILGALLKCIMALTLLTIFAMGVDGIVIGFIIGDIVSLAILVFILRPKILARPRGHGIRPLFKYSLPLFTAYILNFLSTNIDYYLILSLSSLSTAGIYSPAVFLGTMLVTILVAIEQTLLPYFSRIYGKSGLGSLGNISHFVSRYIFLIYFPLGFTILACTPVIISQILGEKYFESIFPSMLLILAVTLTSIGSLFNNILKSAGYSNIFLVSSLGALSVQLLVSLVLIPFLGATGAALARSCAYIILLVLPAYRLRQISGLHYDRKALQKGLVGSAIIASIVFTLNSYLSNPYYLLFNIFSGFACYLIFIRYTGAMNAKDFEILNNILSGKLKWPIRLMTKIVLR